MRIRVDDSLLDDLLAFLERTQCVVERIGPADLDASVPHAPSEGQARLEIGLYVRAWQALNPAARAEIVDGPAPHRSTRRASA